MFKVAQKNNFNGGKTSFPMRVGVRKMAADTVSAQVDNTDRPLVKQLEK
jgi:hypothetical protein